DREGFGNALGVDGIVIVPPRFHLLQLDEVRTVPVDLVGAHEDKNSFRAVPPTRLEQIQRARCVYVEVVKRAFSRKIVTWLSGCMDDEVERMLAKKLQRGAPIANVN